MPSTETPVVPVTSPPLQALVFEAASQKRALEPVLKPQSVATSSVTSETQPNKVSDPSSAFKPEQEASQSPTMPTATPANTSTPNSAPTMVQMQLFASDNPTAQPENQPLSEIDDFHTARDLPTLPSARDQVPATQAMTSAARAETARAVASQMATVVSTRAQPGVIEVALNPEELGRVSIVLNGREDGLHMTISAERPETLEMMRRHISVLESEFQNFGLGDLSLDLGTSADAQRDGPEPDEGAKPPGAQPAFAPEADPAIPKLSPDGRIDIRLCP